MGDFNTWPRYERLHAGGDAVTRTPGWRRRVPARPARSTAPGTRTAVRASTTCSTRGSRPRPEERQGSRYPHQRRLSVRPRSGRRGVHRQVAAGFERRPQSGRSARLRPDSAAITSPRFATAAATTSAPAAPSPTISTAEASSRRAASPDVSGPSGSSAPRLGISERAGARDGQYREESRVTELPWEELGGRPFGDPVSSARGERPSAIWRPPNQQLPVDPGLAYDSTVLSLHRPSSVPRVACAPDGEAELRHA